MVFDVVDAAQNYDLVVAGNGALGMSLGLTLARRGLRVAVVGRADRPHAASAAAGAMNGCFGEVTPHLLRSEHGRLKLAMDFRATALWDGWEEGLLQESDEVALRTAKGTVVILNTVGVPEIDTEGFKAIRTALDEYKEPYEDIDPADVPWIHPAPTHRPLQAMFIPGEHAVDAPALLRALSAALVRNGGTIVDDLVAEVLLDGDRATGVRLTSGEVLSAGHVVLATGAATTKLLGCLPEELRNKIPAVVAGRGVALMVRTAAGTMPPSVIRTPNRAFACGLHVVPRQDGVIYLGATNEVESQVGTTAAIGELNLLLSGASQMHDDLVNGWVERILVGNRPVPLDGFPLLGRAGVDGLWLMTGTYRDGLHQSPLLAAEMAARILGEQADAELDVFTPVRPPIEAMTRDECLEMAVRHTLGSGYEHEWRLPDDWPPMIEKHFRSAFGRSLEQVDPEFVPPPEMFIFADDYIHAALRTYYEAHRGASGR
ncbi:NAD(P)/FAD-dependent oxidoreductase [Dactylosporangium matsuzakiense]|nr:FAD-dependent oxidoreductase [Dactylosporangium matsuzakiense]